MPDPQPETSAPTAPGALRWPEAALTDGTAVLDRMTDADVPAIVEACNDRQSARWLPLPQPYRTRDARAFLADQAAQGRAGTRLTMAIRRAPGGLLLGSISLALSGRAGEGEIGYWVAPAARGQGLAGRATRLLALHGFATSGLARIEILVQPGNTASLHAAQRTGAVHEGLRRRGIRYEALDERHDAHVFALLPEDLRGAATDGPG